jgi:hypothetical protein
MVAEGVGVDQEGNLVGVLLWVDDEGYMNDLEVYGSGGDVDGRPTDTYGKPTVESFDLAEWEPNENGLGGTLKNVPGRKTPGKS